ncbi:unnamed protein product [Scytosiphon promiscuus]
MVEDENSFTVTLEMVRNRREARECATKVAALSKLLEKEQATIRKMHHEAKTLANGSAEAGDGISPEEEKDGGEEAKRAIEQAAEDAVAEQKALKTAEQDKKALGLLKERVTELEVWDRELRNRLRLCLNPQTNQNRTHLLVKLSDLSIKAPAPTAFGVYAPVTVPSSLFFYPPIQTPPLLAPSSSLFVFLGSMAPFVPTSAICLVAAVGGGTAPKIEKGPAPDTLRLEELKADLQATTAAKKKVKGEIKGWLQEFEEKEGRPASNEDKGVIRGQFVEHKRLEKAAAKLTSDIQALEGEIEQNKRFAAAGGVGGEPPTIPNTPTTPTTPAPGGGTGVGAGFGDTSSAAIDAAAAAAVVEKLREENASLAGKLEESERKKALLKTALAELNSTTTKQVARRGRNLGSPEAPSTSSPDRTTASEVLQPETGQPGQLPAVFQEERNTAAAEASTRERELEEGLRDAQKEAREAALTAKKSEHLREEASLALEAARVELKACQLVVDEASEAGRLREQVEALKVDLGAKSRAATAGWDAAANAESEAEAAEARGLRDGIKQGRAEAERKARGINGCSTINLEKLTMIQGPFSRSRS